MSRKNSHLKAHSSQTPASVSHEKKTLDILLMEKNIGEAVDMEKLETYHIMYMGFIQVRWLFRISEPSTDRMDFQ